MVLFKELKLKIQIKFLVMSNSVLLKKLQMLLNNLLLTLSQSKRRYLRININMLN